MIDGGFSRKYGGRTNRASLPADNALPPDVGGNLIILTGATGAIGTALTHRLAAATRQPLSPFYRHTLLLACRNRGKAQKLREELENDHREVRCEVAELDLADEQSVRRFAASPLIKASSSLTLMNNAGVMRREYGTDAMGRELSLAVNYFNTRLLTELLLREEIEEREKRGRLRRVVFTTSITRCLYKPFRERAKVSETEFHQLRTYALSKRLITDYAATLHASGRCEVACADPGVVDTGMIRMQRWYDPLADLFFRPLIRKPWRGSLPAWRALTSEAGYIYCARRRHSLPDKKTGF